MVWNVLGKKWERLGTFGKILGNIIYIIPKPSRCFAIMSLRL